jgi:hypothetical protein
LPKEEQQRENGMKSKFCLVAVLAIVLASGTAWGRGGGGGGHFGGSGGHFGGHGFHGDDRFAHGGHFFHDRGGAFFFSPYYYYPYYPYDYAYCDPYSPYYRPAYCY